MISKRIGRSKNSQGNFSALGNYTRDASHQGEKCLFAWYEGCQAESYDIALQEIELTQELNIRSRKDKTYHLLVSLRPEDEQVLTKEICQDIERVFADKLGLSEHQRVIGVHKNTNNVHLHIAYNLVHPEKFTVANPYFDDYKQADACRELEARYGFQVDNRGERQEGKKKLEQRAASMEAQAGQESFQTFALEQNASLLQEIDKAKNWQEVHRHFAKFGMAVKAQGNGLAVVNQDGKKNEAIKASALDRSLSKSRLEKRFGSYVGPEKGKDTVHPKEKYARKPIQQQSTARNALYKEFLVEARQRQELLAAAKVENLQGIADIKARQSKEKTALNQKIMATQTKIILRRQMRERHKSELDAERAKGSGRLVEIRKSSPFSHWNSFLKFKAQAGNTEALGVLKSKKIDFTAESDFDLQKKLQERYQEKERKILLAQDGNSCSLKQKLVNIVKMDYLVDLERMQGGQKVFDGTTYRIDNNGVTIYSLPHGGTIRDDGRMVFCSADATTRKAAEIFSRARFGKNIVIDGNRMAKRPAALVKMDALVNMEAMDSVVNKEEAPGASNNLFTGTKFKLDGSGRVVTYTLPCGGVIRDDGYSISFSSEADTRRAAEIYSRARFGRCVEKDSTFVKGANESGKSAETGKPKRQSHFTRIRQVLGNSLRRMSEFAMVRHSQESRVLLPTNARRDLER